VPSNSRQPPYEIIAVVAWVAALLPTWLLTNAANVTQPLNAAGFIVFGLVFLALFALIAAGLYVVFSRWY